MTTATKTNAKSYELYLVISPNAINEDSSKLEQDLEAMFQNNGVRVVKKDSLSKAELAYPMDKIFFAYTGSYYLAAEPEQIKALEEEFQNSDIQPLRWMIATIKNKKMPVKRAPMPSLEKELEKVEKATGEDEDNDKEKAENKEKDTKKEDAGKESSIEDIDKKLDEIMGNL